MIVILSGHCLPSSVTTSSACALFDELALAKILTLLSRSPAT
jgi:hypothetical protein